MISAMRHFYLLMLSLLLPICSIGEELPQIELPEYVITGVEKATRISGDKLPVTSMPQLITPRQMRATGRPDLIPSGIVHTPTRPDISAILSDGRFNASITGGQYELEAVSVDFAKVLNDWTINAKSGFAHYPKRSGHTTYPTFSAEISGTSYIAERSLVTTQLSFIKDIFHLVGPFYQEYCSTSDFQLSSTLAPISFGKGRFAAFISYDRLKIEPYYRRDSDLFALNLNFDTKLGSGWFESRFSGWYDRYDDVSLITIAGEYNQSIWYGWMMRFGGTLASTKNSPSGNFTNGYFTVSLERPSLFGGRVRLLRDAGVDMISMKSLMNRWYMVEPVSMVSEMVSRIALYYDREFTDRLRGAFSVENRVKRHEPFPLFSNSREWVIEPRRLESLLTAVKIDYEIDRSLSASMYAINDQAVSYGRSTGERDLQRPEWQFGSQLRYRWRNWTIENELELPYSGLNRYQGTDKKPDRLIDNFSVSRSFSEKVDFKIGIDNLFNSRYYDIPGYDEDLFTLYLKFSYKNIF